MIIITCRSCVFYSRSAVVSHNHLAHSFTLSLSLSLSLVSVIVCTHTDTGRCYIIIFVINVGGGACQEKKIFHDGGPAPVGAEPNRRGGGHRPADRCRPRTSWQPSAWRQSTTAHRPRAHTLFTDDVRARHTVDRKRFSYKSDYELFF